MKKIHSIYKILIISIGVMVITSCGNKSTNEAVDEDKETEESNIVLLTPDQIENAGIVLGKVEHRQISGTVKVNGVLDVPPQQLVSISAPLGGFLKNTILLQGSHVKRGQQIATVENLDFIQLQQDYIEAKNQFDFAKADYERQQQLAVENVNSTKTLQQSKTTYVTWLGKYNGLKEKLKVLNLNSVAVEGGNISSTIPLYSPINGYVTEVNVNIGKFVNPSDVLFEIVDTEHLHAELTVFEKDVPKLKMAQKVRFTLANETSERMATVYLIGREITADRTIRIHCHIDKEDTDLLPGMYLKAMVETGGALVNALPDQAIIDYQGVKYIFIASEERDHSEDGQHFTMVEVKIGDKELGYTEIDLPKDFKVQNTSVVIKGAYSLLAKMKNSEEEE